MPRKRSFAPSMPRIGYHSGSAVVVLAYDAIMADVVEMVFVAARHKVVDDERYAAGVGCAVDRYRVDGRRQRRGAIVKIDRPPAAR
jgi:hypothetical protein